MSNIEPICGDEELLISYLYGECEQADRARMDAHMAICSSCQAELRGLQTTQEWLAGWDAPEAPPALKLVRPREGEPADAPSRRTPAWSRFAGLAAAAVLVLAVGATIARVEIRYDASGVTVRTGWGSTGPTTGSAIPESDPERAPWRPELAALEERLRGQMISSSTTEPNRETAASTAPAGADPSSDLELLRRVRAIVQESERKQERELALRLAQAVREIDAQRQTDWIRIQQGFGRLEGMTNNEMAGQRELLNYLVRVSSSPQR